MLFAMNTAGLLNGSYSVWGRNVYVCECGGSNVNNWNMSDGIYIG